MYAAQNKDAIKPESYPLLSVAKGDYVSKSTLAEAIQSLFHKPKTACQRLLFLRFYNSVAVGSG